MKRFIVLILSILLVIVFFQFYKSDESKALDLMKLACRIEKNEISGEYESAERLPTPGKVEKTWDPRTIPLSDLKVKYEYTQENSRNAAEAAHLDSNWNRANDALITMVTFLDYVYSERMASRAYAIEWDNSDFNEPRLVYITECSIAESLINK